MASCLFVALEEGVVIAFSFWNLIGTALHRGNALTCRVGMQAIRSVSCFIITVIWGAVKGQTLPKMFGSRPNFPALLLRGTAGASSMSFFYFGVLKLTMADAVGFFCLKPSMQYICALHNLLA